MISMDGSEWWDMEKCPKHVLTQYCDRCKKNTVHEVRAVDVGDGVTDAEQECRACGLTVV